MCVGFVLPVLMETNTSKLPSTACSPRTRLVLVSCRSRGPGWPRRAVGASCTVRVRCGEPLRGTRRARIRGDEYIIHHCPSCSLANRSRNIRTNLVKQPKVVERDVMASTVAPAPVSHTVCSPRGRRLRKRLNCVLPRVVGRGCAETEKPSDPSYQACKRSARGSPHVYSYSICTCRRPAAASLDSAALTSALATPVPWASGATARSPQ